MATAPQPSRLPIGQRLRDRRMEQGMAQTALAAAVGISASYLNLIEHDKRAIGGALLQRIAHALDVDLDHLVGTGDHGLVQDLLELVSRLELDGVDAGGAARFVAREPDWAMAFRTIHRRYQEAQDTASALSDRLSQDPKLVAQTHALLNRITAIKSIASILHADSEIDDTQRRRFSEIISIESDLLGSSARDMIELLGQAADAPKPATPRTDVDDFIIASGNHFPVLEDAAERLGSVLALTPESTERRLADHLTEDRGVAVTSEPSDDPNAIFVDPLARAATRRFQLARAVVARNLHDEIDALVQAAGLSSGAAETTAHLALENYGAGALLAPYDAFLEAAETNRYDIDRLGFAFALSFEQTAHRMVTLRRPGAEGVPFAFLRADPAGNLSKPFSTIGLRMPRLGGACPLWVLYGVFATPDRTVAQLAVMPQGERYLFVARRLAKRVAAFGAPQSVFSVMIGCDAVYAERVVYGDGLVGDGKNSLATPVGQTCASCSRTGCPQRATPFVLG